MNTIPLGLKDAMRLLVREEIAAVSYTQSLPAT